MSANTLKQFVEQTKTDIDNFEKEYLEKNKETPEMYPIEFGDDNNGLWIEFFMSYIQGNGV